MLTLYVKDDCPYSAKVLMAGELMGLTFDRRNIADPEAAQELMELGGKQQTPFLVDTDTGEAMYEADEIVAYLEKTYGDGEDTYLAE